MSNNNNNHDDLPLRPDDDKDDPHIGEKVNFNGEEYYLYGANTLAEAKGYERIRLGRHESIPDINSFEVRTDKLDPPIIERGSRNRKTPAPINPLPGYTLPSSNTADPQSKKVTWSKNGEKSNNNNSRRSSISVPFSSPVAAMNIPVTPATQRRTPRSDNYDDDVDDEDFDDADDDDDNDDNDENDDNDDDDDDDDDDYNNNKKRNHSKTILSTIHKRKNLYERFYKCRRELELGSIGTLLEYTSDEDISIKGLITSFDANTDVFKIYFIGYDDFSSFKLLTCGNLKEVLEETKQQADDPKLLYGVGVRNKTKDDDIRNGMIVYYDIEEKNYWFVLVGDTPIYCIRENSIKVNTMMRDYYMWCNNNNIHAKKIGIEKYFYESYPCITDNGLETDIENDTDEDDLVSIESYQKEKRKARQYKPRKPLAKTSYKINQIKQFVGTFDITKYDEKLLDGVVFCFTGNIDDDKDKHNVLTRDSLEDIVIQLGGRIINNLSGTANYLVCGGRLSNYGGPSTNSVVHLKKQHWNYRRGKTYNFAQDVLVQHGLVIVEGKELFYCLLHTYQLKKNGIEVDIDVSDESASDSDSDDGDVTQSMLYDIDQVDIKNNPILPIISFDYDIDVGMVITKDSNEHEIESYILVNSYYICKNSNGLKNNQYQLSEWKVPNQIHQAIFHDNEKPNKSKNDVKKDILLIEDCTKLISNFKDQPKIVKDTIVNHIMKRSMHARFSKLKQRFISLDECRLRQQENIEGE